LAGAVILGANGRLQQELRKKQCYVAAPAKSIYAAQPFVAVRPFAAGSEEFDNTHQETVLAGNKEAGQILRGAEARAENIHTRGFFPQGVRVAPRAPARLS